MHTYILPLVTVLAVGAWGPSALAGNTSLMVGSTQPADGSSGASIQAEVSVTLSAGATAEEWRQLSPHLQIVLMPRDRLKCRPDQASGWVYPLPKVALRSAEAMTIYEKTALDAGVLLGETTYDAAKQTLRFKPRHPLAAGTEYAAAFVVHSETDGAHVWTFTTAGAAPDRRVLSDFLPDLSDAACEFVQNMRGRHGGARGEYQNAVSARRFYAELTRNPQAGHRMPLLHREYQQRLEIHGLGGEVKLFDLAGWRVLTIPGSWNTERGVSAYNLYAAGREVAFEIEGLPMEIAKLALQKIDRAGLEAHIASQPWVLANALPRVEGWTVEYDAAQGAFPGTSLEARYVDHRPASSPGLAVKPMELVIGRVDESNDPLLRLLLRLGKLPSAAQEDPTTQLFQERDWVGFRRSRPEDDRRVTDRGTSLQAARGSTFIRIHLAQRGRHADVATVFQGIDLANVHRYLNEGWDGHPRPGK